MSASRLRLITVSFLITGNLIGAGILALPVNAGLAGFVPAFAGMIIMCGMMYYTAIILAREANATRQLNFNYPSLYHKHLGSTGKWIAVVANLIILYGLLTAYLVGATTVITRVTGWTSPVTSRLVLLVCFFCFTGITVLGIQLIKRCNILLMVLIWASFITIAVIAGRHIEPSRLTFHDWPFLPITVPIIITAFHFHNIIPTICADMKWDARPIARAILLGMIIGLIMNTIWIFVGIGALPMIGPGSLDAAFHADVPATVPLAKLIGSNVFLSCALVFTFLAIVTSYFANGLGLIGFIRDLLENFFGTQNRLLVALFAFGPPLLISMIYPNIFLKAMNVVGGLGIVTLFGILPCLIAFKKTKHPGLRLFALVMCFMFSAFLVMEICQETGLFRIRPEVEHWNHHLLSERE